MKNKILILLIVVLLVFSITTTVFCSHLKEPEKIIVKASNIQEQIDTVKEVILTEEEIIEQKINHMNEEINSIHAVKNKQIWFIEYKKIIEKYKDITNPISIYKIFSEDEIFLMLRVIETECYQADFLSKVNVANVILNRINSSEFGKTVNDVVTSEYQFAYWRNDISYDTELALEYAFMIEDTTNGCLAFHSNEKTDSFYGFKYQFTDNIGHHFFK